VLEARVGQSEPPEGVVVHDVDGASSVHLGLRELVLGDLWLDD
jgi:hypothetical protein